ncbi:MAG: hypothetical protein K0U93_09820, partial [Gammaproteobacteria bacterium]|nr:hypothetical protein [Gammaproteobacteria bacterium]
MSTTRKNDSTTVIRVATCSALALILSGTPVVIDLTNGPSVEWSDTYAKSCFIAGTQVHMADGSVKPIELVRIGDRVLGQDGVVNTVREIERRRLGGRRLYRLNDSRAFVTAEHPFMTTDGWSAINPLMTARENSALKVRRLTLGAKLARLVTAVPADAVGSGLNLAPTAALQWQTLVVLEATDAAPSTAVFNLLLDGDHSYFADGFLVHNKDGGEGGEGGEGEGGGEGGESGSGEGGESGSGSGAGEGG